jgi:tripartite-type tricarboxylate transporter receptor subunit TctC
MRWHLNQALIGGLAGMAALFAVASGHAAEFPARPIRLVVPYPAGGPTDIIGRMAADFLAKDLKQAAIVENKPGAQGAIGAEAVARGEPDGYTLLVVSGSMLAQNPMLYKKLPYDPARDFRVLALITEVPVVMEVHPSVPARTIAEFVAYARQHPGQLSFGSAGTGGTIHLAGEMFRQMAGIEMVHVPYKGAAPALTDLLAGNIQLMFDSLGTALPPVRAGSLRALGISSAQRNTDLPDVPTIAESGYPGYLVSVWFGIVVPAKVPDPVAAILKHSLDRALDNDTFRATLGRVGYSVMRPQSDVAIAAFIEADRARWSAVIKTRNISLD